MTQKELRKLSRQQLLELMLEQSRRIDELEAQLAEANRKLESREIAISKCGSVAEAAMALNGVFEAAQAAAEQYVAEVRRRADAER